VVNLTVIPGEGSIDRSLSKAHPVGLCPCRADPAGSIPRPPSNKASWRPGVQKNGGTETGAAV